MQYLGGKSRIARQIAEIINKHVTKDTNFISLFCGTCSVESRINTEHKTLNDAQPYLIALLKAVQKGWEIPSEITREQYYDVKRALGSEEEDKALAGFVGFGCSFGGKWFGGYAKNNSGTNYALQSKNSMLKKMEGMKTAVFINKDYRDFVIWNGSVIYCDPPYANTTKYANSPDFDSEEFWEYMRELSKDNLVFISELQAPEDFVSIWEKPFKRVLDVNKENIFESKEKLFIHKSKLPLDN